EATSSELREELPILEGSITYGEGKSWGGEVPIGPQVLTVLAADGRILRASNDGAWTASRPRWAATAAWLGSEIEPPSTEEGLAVLIESWLRAFGPGTEADLKWWLGGTLTAVREALASLEVAEVEIDGATGYLMADDLDPSEPVEPWVALLPALDPTPMGWYERDWYLGAHADRLTDRNGNIGATAWWEGRIVGGWRQPKESEDAEVEIQLLEDVGAEGEEALEAEAARLTAWLDGTRIAPRFPSPLSKA
ncbi:MAG: winged helix DNA-binding domain-containing protein, partial [Solirubrobacterales bacterium]